MSSAAATGGGCQKQECRPTGPALPAGSLPSRSSLKRGGWRVPTSGGQKNILPTCRCLLGWTSSLWRGSELGPLLQLPSLAGRHALRGEGGLWADASLYLQARGSRSRSRSLPLTAVWWGRCEEHGKSLASRAGVHGRALSPEPGLQTRLSHLGRRPQNARASAAFKRSMVRAGAQGEGSQPGVNNKGK